MQLSNFDYHLPSELIAQTPLEPRDSSRLLCLDKNSGQLEDKVFRDIEGILTDNDVLVVNETRVIKARLKGYIMQPSSFCKKGEIQRGILEGIKEQNTLKPCEIFLHKQISENTWDCLVYPGKKLKPGTKITFQEQSLQPSSFCKKGEIQRGIQEEISESENYSPHDKGQIQRGIQEQTLQPLSFSKGENYSPHDKGELEGVIKDISQKGRVVEFSHSGQEFLDIIDTIGETPLPPYIKDHSSPSERYQTVYHDSEKAGSVAAPTAGLHFTPELLQKLKKKGVQIEKVCLHVGLGTFANVEVEDIEDHHMHSESAYISKETSERLNTAKKDGKRVIAVGTTSVRTLESFAQGAGKLGHGNIDTEIFIYPGYEWKFVDSIITNFHLPKSTLLMLVSSFAGDEHRKKAYQHAVESQYRFFSFGDAMWIY